MAKDKGRELRKSGVGGLGERRPAKDRSQSSQRPAEGKRCGLRCGLTRGGTGGREPAGAPSPAAGLQRFARLGQEALCARLRGEVATAPHGALPLCLGLPAPAAYRLCTSHPSLLLRPAPPPSAAAGRAPPARIYCTCEWLGRSHTPTEGSHLAATVVRVA